MKQQNLLEVTQPGFSFTPYPSLFLYVIISWLFYWQKLPIRATLGNFTKHTMHTWKENC